MNKNLIMVSEEELRFIWSLGFSTGRVEALTKGRKGHNWNDEEPLYISDIKRLQSANKPLANKIFEARKKAK